MAELLAGAAMAVVPSVSGDVMPFAALEAMAAGVPVVASDAGSLPEVVGAERTVPRADAAALAARMAELFGDPERRRREGDALIARAREAFGEERYVRELRAVTRVATRAAVPRQTTSQLPSASASAVVAAVCRLQTAYWQRHA